MAFPPQFLDDVRARLSLSELIGRKVRLIRRGREFVGLCPFHNEKTPSFTVVEDKGFFHCFGCGVHGDAIGFVMKIDNLDFREAVEKLAREAGLPLPRERPRDGPRPDEQRSLYAAAEAAARWFSVQLAAPAAATARAYLEKRGLDAATIERFRLGFAPDSRGALRTALKREGFSEDALVGSGLLIQPEDGGAEPYDRFRGRIMFPIADKRGRIVAFGGRALGEGQPKYLNSPETPVFHKGALLYALPLALERARKKHAIVVVEGYMDVIALHRVGISNAVAPLGTALTEHQIEELWRVADEPVVCFDGDAAGERAAFRAAERAMARLKPGKSLKFAFLPEGQDPDDLIAEGGAERLRAALLEARPLADVLFDRAVRETGFETPERQAGARAQLEQWIERIPDRAVRDSYLQHIRSRLWEAARRPRAEARTRAASVKTPNQGGLKTTAMRRQVHANLGLERVRLLLQTLLGFPALVAEFSEELERLEIVVPRYRPLRNAIIEAPSFDEGAALRDYLRAKPELGVVLDELCGGNARYLDWTARPLAASVADARTLVRHIFDLHHRLVELEIFKKEAEAAFAADPSEENLARLIEATRLLQQAPGFEDQIADYGRASGRASRGEMA